MSNKKNTPISIYGKNKALRKTIFYKVDGVQYREIIDLDTANGNFGRSLFLEEQYVRERFPAFDPLPGMQPVHDYRSVKNKEKLEVLQDSTERITAYSNFLEKIKKREGADDAFSASDMSDITDFDSILAVGHNIPLPPTPGETENPKNSDTGTKIEPNEIFADYKDIFKEHLKYPIDMFIGKGFSVTGGPTTGNNPFVKGTGEGSQDYIFIEQFMYIPPQPRLARPKFEDTRDGRRREQEYDETLLGNILERGIRRGQNTFGDPMGSCILPIPNRLGVSQGVNWGEGRANAIELGAFNAVTNATANLVGKDGGGLIKLLTDGATQARSVFNTVAKQLRENDGGANAGTVINATVAKSVLGRLGINVDVDQFLTRETGAAINPNLELLFSGPQLRTFSFVFNFAPNSTEEATMVRKIHRWFRQGMLAQKTTDFGNGGSLFLGSPNVFRLCYKNNNRRIKGLNTFKICALTSVQVDFTPDGVYQSYEDEFARSQPVRSTMKVDFNELTPIFANDYKLNDESNIDPSIEDLGLNVRGSNAFTEDDLGF